MREGFYFALGGEHYSSTPYISDQYHDEINSIDRCHAINRSPKDNISSKIGDASKTSNSK